MPAEIIQTQQVASMEVVLHTKEVTVAKQRDLLQKSKDMIAGGVSFGVRRFMYFGAALYNIKQNNLFLLDEDTPTWIAFLHSIDLDKGDAHRYVGIGAAMYEHLVAQGAIDREIPAFIYQKDIDQHFKQSFDNLRGMTLRELSGLSKRLDAFNDAMNGIEIVKLLPSGKSEEEADKLQNKNDRDAEQSFDQHMKKVCESFGFKWDRKAQRCVHKDGTPLTDEEYAQITRPDSAVRVWDSLKRDILTFRQKTFATIDQHGANYMRYAKAIPNSKMEADVREVYVMLQEQVEAVKLVLDNLFAGDDKRITELKKKGAQA